MTYNHDICVRQNHEFPQVTEKSTASDGQENTCRCFFNMTTSILAIRDFKIYASRCHFHLSSNYHDPGLLLYPSHPTRYTLNTHRKIMADIDQIPAKVRMKERYKHAESSHEMEFVMHVKSRLLRINGAARSLVTQQLILHRKQMNMLIPACCEDREAFNG